MAVPIKRYGISEVYPGDDPSADLVLVHGLNGHPRDTWTASGSTAFWPQDLLPKTIPRRVRILAYGYNATASDLLGDTSSDQIHHHAQTLVQELFANRSLEDAVQRPIIFLCHSLGGVIVKRALDYSVSLRARTVEHLRSIFVSTSGIIFLSVPHNGADPAAWRRMLQSLYQTALPSNTPLCGTQLVSALEPQSTTLQDINISFAQIMSQFRLFFFHETLKTRFGESLDFIVDQHSAAPIFEGAEYAGIEATHLNICRFETKDSPGYNVVAEAINRWAIDTIPIIRMRWEYERDLRRRHAFAKASEYVIHSGSGGRQNRYHSWDRPINHCVERGPKKVAGRRPAYGRKERFTAPLNRFLFSYGIMSEIAGFIERDRKNFLSLVSAIDSEYEHRRLRKLIFRGTCRWILENEDFREWFNGGQSSCLWCSGIPGAGKTVLTSVIVHHARLRRGKSGSALAFFYCTSFDPRTLTALTILGSFAMQLMTQFEQLSKPLPAILTRKAAQAHDECRNSFDTDDLVEILLAFATNSLETYFILDGLDECIPEEREKMLSFFEQLLQRKVSGSTYRILISSRDDVNVSQEIPSCTRLPIHDTDVQGDICEYVSNTVDDLIQKRKLKVRDESLIVDIKERLTIGAQGMFLWVAFQIRDLCKEGKTDFMIRRILDTLPKGLNETYSRCLEKIRVHQPTKLLAREALKWVSLAKRPLRVEELEEAIAFGPNDDHWDESKIPNIDIVSTCANLVIMDESEKLVRLAHHTVKEFLFSMELRGNSEFFSFDLEQSNLEIGEDCIRYLSFSDFQPTKEQPRSYLKYILPPSRTVGQTLPPILSGVDSGKYRLLDYARANWIAHTTQILKSSPVWKDFRRLALQEGQPRTVQQSINTTSTGALSNYGQFELAIENGHIPLLKLWRDGSRRGLKDLCEQGVANKSFPLHSVVKSGSESACKLLLQVCDVNVCDTEGKIALHCAVEQKHGKIVALLLDKGAKINARDSKRRTALHLAVQGGHEAVVRLLLDRGADVNIGDSNGWTALPLAARSGHEAILRLLLDRGVNARSDRGLALILAAQEGHEEVARLLLKGGADIKGGYGQAAMPTAARNGHGGIVRLLLDSGVDVNGKDLGGWTLPSLEGEAKAYLMNGAGMTALHGAAYGGHEAVARLLLEGGADINTKGSNTSTALHGAAVNMHEAIVRLLLGEGADANVEDSNGWTPLLWAAQSGQKGVVQLLLEGGADVNACDIRGMTALHLAIRAGHEEVVQLLLNRGADVHRKGSGGSTALHFAAIRGRDVVVRALLERGADINVGNVVGRTALYKAVWNRRETVVRLLLENGADINASGVTTPLHAAVESENETLVRLLIENGADINASDATTPLQAAVERENETLVRLLLEAGADANIRCEGVTALGYAVKTGQEAIVRLLTPYTHHPPTLIASHPNHQRDDQ